MKTAAKHIAANKFAAAVLLPQKSFIEKVYETGFDVIELARIYSKSCSQSLLRIGEVLQGKLFFYAALYEPDADNIWKVTYCTASRNNEDSEANIYGLDNIFPRRNSRVKPGSLVDVTVREGKPHFAEHISLLDDMDSDGLSAVANPLLVQGIAAKVALMVLPEQNKRLLFPQVEKLNPVTVERFHLHL